MLCRIWCLLIFVAFTAEMPLEIDPVLYCGLWRSPFVFLGPLLVSVPGISLYPWQMILAALAPLGLFRPGAFKRRAPAMDLAIGVSFFTVAVTFMWGFLRGGSAYQAYYQLWRLLAALLVGLLLPCVIRSSRDLRALGLAILSAALVRGYLVIYFYWAIVVNRKGPPPEYMTTHDDSLLFVVAILMTLSWALARRRPTSWMLFAVVFPFLIYAIVLNNRRLAWLELIAALPFIYTLLPRNSLKRRVTYASLAALPAVLVYVVVGWGRSGPLFEPLRAFSTAGSNQDASSLARLEEIRNLLFTLSNSNPILGTGWGMPYQEVTSIYTHFGAAFWQYPYLPHNSLLGVAAFSGLAGIVGIWITVPVAAFFATRGYLGGPTSTDRAAAMSSLCFLPAYGIHCYGDIGLQSLTCGLLFGVSMAIAAKVSAFAQQGAAAVVARPERTAPPLRVASVSYP